jgi:Ca2+-transporting ATPase
LRSTSAAIAVAAAIGSALVLVQFRPLAEVLHLSPLHFDDWLIAGLGGLLAGALAAWLPRGSGASIAVRPYGSGR